MRVMKKIMTGMSVTAFALAIAGGVNAVEADAAGSATFDAVAQTMTAKGTGEVHVSFNAIKVTTKNVKQEDGTTKKETTLALNASAAWDVYDGASATVDLSNLKTTADQYIAVKDTTAAVPTVYCIPANTNKFTGAYGVNGSSKKGELTFKKGKEEVSALKDGYFQYQTVNANVWTDYAASKFVTAQYEKQGATLYFRQKAVAITLPKTATACDGFNLYTATAGNFAGTEFKVKIAKEANAPSATVNYDTATFTVKAGQEYRQKAAAGWTAVSQKSLPVTLTAAQLGAAGIFEVRTAATEKKVASKIKVYSYAAATAPVAAEFKLEPVATTNKTGNVSNPDDYKVEGKVNVYYNLSSAGLAQINFLNKTDNAYTLFGEDPLVNPSAKAIAALPANATKPVTKAETVVKPGTALYIVRNSNKKTGVFRSLAYKVIASVAYPTSPVLTAAAKGTPVIWTTALKADATGAFTPKDNMLSYYYNTAKGANQMNFWNKSNKVIMIYAEDPNANPAAKAIATLPANATKVTTIAATKLPEAGKPIYIVTPANYKDGTFRTVACSTIKVTYPAN